MIRRALRSLVVLALAGGCSEPPRERCELSPTLADASMTGAIDKASPADRRLLGAASDYPADPAIAARGALLVASQRARREAAWEVVRRVVAPVPLGEDAGALDGQVVPRFRTWLDRDDARRVFQRAYEGLGPDGRRARAPLGDALLDEAFAWNVAALEDDPAWTPTRWQAYLASVDAPGALSGVGGIRRLAMSGAGLRHVLESYAAVLGCVDEGAPAAFVGAEDVPKTRGGCEAAFAPVAAPACLRGPFPAETASVAEEWRRLGPDGALPTFDTSAPALAARYALESASWGDGDGTSRPGADAIYTVSAATGATYALAGMHIRTRELDRYVNITLWYSDDPDTDFGADRPTSLGAPWSSYKMCVAVDFEEQDPSPRGGFDGSLGDALAVVHEGVGGPSFCSNPYIDAGPGLVRSNCVGCHQHAMSGVRPADVALERDAQRDNFPADQYWGLDAGDDLASVLQETIDWWKSADGG